MLEKVQRDTSAILYGDKALVLVITQKFRQPLMVRILIIRDVL
jgi:hypothetical protein